MMKRDPFIRPRWVPASMIPQELQVAIKEAEAARIKRNDYGMKPLRLRRDLYALQACWMPGSDDLHSVKVGLVRAHPKADEFPEGVRQFLTRSYRLAQVMAREYSVGAAYYNKLERISA